MVWIQLPIWGYHSGFNFISRISGQVKKSMYLQFSLNIQQRETDSLFFFFFLVSFPFFFFKPPTHHSHSSRAGLTWGPGTAKIHAPLCRDRYWQTSPNLIVQLMMPQSLKMVLFSPGLKASSYHLESCTSWSLLNCLR